MKVSGKKTVLTVIYVIAVVLNMAVSLPVSLQVFYPQTQNLNNVNFYGNTFTLFYNCLTLSSTSLCILNYTTDLYKPYNNSDNNYYVSSVMSSSHTTVPSGTYSFSCNLNPLVSQVVCHRNSSSVCNTDLCQTVRLQNSVSCKSCVVFLWLSHGEQLIYNSETDNINDCSSDCIHATASASASSSALYSASSSTSSSGQAYTITSTANPDLHKLTRDNDKVALIAGTVTGVLIIIIIITIIFIFKFRRQRQHDNDHVNIKSASTAHIHTRKDTEHKQSSCNLENQPGLVVNHLINHVQQQNHEDIVNGCSTNSNDTYVDTDVPNNHDELKTSTGGQLLNTGRIVFGEHYYDSVIVGDSSNSESYNNVTVGNSNNSESYNNVTVGNSNNPKSYNNVTVGNSNSSKSYDNLKKFANVHVCATSSNGYITPI